MSLASRVLALATAIGAAIKSDRARIAALETNRIAIGSATVAVNALLLNNTQDVTITFLKPMPSISYDYVFSLGNFAGLTLTNFSVTKKTQTVNGVTVTVKSGIAILTGSFLIQVTAQ